MAISCILEGAIGEGDLVMQLSPSSQPTGPKANLING